MADKNVALAKLTDIVQKGKERAAAGMQALMQEYEQRRDLMVRPDALDFEVTAATSQVPSVIRPVIDGSTYTLTSHARSQLLGRASIPVAFADTLAERNLGDLLRENLRRLLAATSRDGMLVRSIVGSGPATIKGILSPSYRRLDASPLFESFLERGLAAGFVPHSGDVSDTRAFLSLIRPEVREIGPSEWVVFGLEFRSSDYGRGAMELGLMVLRLVCSNGMIGSNLFRQVHVGRRFDDFSDGGGVIELSRKTIALDARTVRSALGDAVGSADRKLLALESSLKEHAKEGLDVARTLATLQKKGIRKDTLQKVETMYGQPLPIEAVPQEQGRWRFANVLSLLANGAKGDDAKDLQDAAYDIMFAKA